MPIYDAHELETFAAATLRAAGMDDDHARTTAATLVTADLLGYRTHGVQFLPQYCGELEAGKMTAQGAPLLLSDRGDSIVYDGQLLPGPVCLGIAVAELLNRSPDHAVVSAAIRRSANTACLATYLLPIVAKGLIGIVMVSTPGGRAVAPAGGREGRYSTNPLAFGFPTGGDPVLIDMATSATTNRRTEKLQREHGVYIDEPLIDKDGHTTNDPLVLTKQRGGAIRPMGGIANEHKGFALALAVQALSTALAGGGVAGRQEGSSTLIQVIDPERFAGATNFSAEMDLMIEQFIATPSRPGSDAVRIPGQRAMIAHREQSRNGVEISDALQRHIVPLAETYGVSFPQQRDIGQPD